MNTTQTIATLNLSAKVRTSLDEVGMTSKHVDGDIRRMRDGLWTRSTLLDHCLDGAEGKMRAEAWEEYVDAVVAAAEREPLCPQDECGHCGLVGRECHCPVSR